MSMRVRLAVFKHRPEISGASLDLLREAALQSPAIRSEVDFSLRDYADDDDEQVARETFHDAPDVLALSCYVWGVERSIRLATRIKELGSRALVVLGGPELIGLERIVLEDNPALDVVVHGEGEEAFRELLEALLRGPSPRTTAGLEAVAGLSFRCSAAGIVSTPRRAVRERVDDVPSPYLSGRYFEWRQGRLATHCAVIEQYRGCPFRCAFCVWARGIAPLRWFDEARVLAEIDALDRAGVPELCLADASLTIDRSRAKRLLRHLSAKRFRRIDAFVQLAHLDQELCQLVADVPGLMINVGIQAVKDETLRHLRRTDSLAPRHRERLERIMRGTARVRLQAIVGLPTDRAEDFRATLSECMAAPGAPELQLFQLQVLPGSEYWARAAELGLGATESPPHYVRGSGADGVARLGRMKLDAWVATQFYNRDLLHYLERAYAAALALETQGAAQTLLWAVADRLWSSGELHELPDGLASRLTTEDADRVFAMAHTLLLEARLSPVVAADALALDRAVAYALVPLPDPRRGAVQRWPVHVGYGRVAIPWARAAPPDGACVQAVSHSLGLAVLAENPPFALPDGRATRDTMRTSIVWATDRKVHLFELPGSLAELGARCGGDEPLGPLVLAALREVGAPMVD